MASRDFSPNQRVPLDDEEELQSAFSALARAPLPMRPEYALQLHGTLQRELVAQAARRGRPWWLAWLSRSGSADQPSDARTARRPVAPSRAPSLRFAMAGVVALVVLVLTGVTVTQLYPVGPSAQATTIQVSAGKVHVARPVHVFVDIGLMRSITVSPGEQARLQSGDQLTSDPVTDAEIALPDGSKMMVGSGAQLTVEELQARTVSRPLVVAMRLDRGEVLSQVERLRVDQDRFEVKTPNLVAQVRGTVFRVDVRSDGTRVATDKGLVSVSWNGQTIDVKAGQELSVLLRASAPEVYIRPQSPTLICDLPPETVAVVNDEGQTTFFTALPEVGLRIQSQPNVTVEVFANEELVGTVRTDAAGQATLAFVPPGEGTFRLTTMMSNAAGEKSLSSAPQWLVIDRTRPGLWLDQPEEPQVSTQDVIVAGRTEPGVRLTLNEQPVTVDAEGQFRLTVTLKPGANDLNWVAMDRAGNTIRLQSVVEYEQAGG